MQRRILLVENREIELDLITVLYGAYVLYSPKKSISFRRRLGRSAARTSRGTQGHEGDERGRTRECNGLGRAGDKYWWEPAECHLPSEHWCQESWDCAAAVESEADQGLHQSESPNMHAAGCLEAGPDGCRVIATIMEASLIFSE